jgi:hypothetical protein
VNREACFLGHSASKNRQMWRDTAIEMAAKCRDARLRGALETGEHTRLVCRLARDDDLEFFRGLLVGIEPFDSQEKWP